MTVSFYTLGCKVNQYESEALGEIFESLGVSVVPISQSSDIIVVNSCTVTAESNRKTRQTVRKLKKKSPNAFIVLTGCMAQAFPKESTEISEVDLIIGNTDYDKLPQAVLNAMNGCASRVLVSEHHKTYTDIGVTKMDEHTRAFIKIEDGCNRFC
ncbi:MAG: tRNA (N(6)-L-threonylcarbamoyladenosine(37)-C(2))-methylthiotransferase MtaB, partial [Clostridia bacterium]|nr:tRNA (N(6)-L-threonylcarbamoyladenosine(37)-C(2))-methylthiotransferase MtaB [Clostridia bacterium]